MIGTVVKKELRGYFNSAIAVITLAAFVAVAAYTLFWHEKFFARGLADLRPLFEWMPKITIILVATLAMRMWAEERRSGTLEVLLTLPVPRWQLVVGKFAAGMVLVAIALALTLGMPLTIAHMGKLDWGPVIGGYLATLLLAGAYLSIGMCVSAATDNQIVAYIVTAIACIALWMADFIGGDVGRALGSGAHFASVARGVLDLRDLAYYLGITATGIALNVLLLQRLTWSRGPAAHVRRVSTVVAVVLVAANAIALDAWLAPIRRARIDLTSDRAYSLSSATDTMLAGLDEPLLIRGYFSAKTHPKLAPLIPQIRDLLDEYRIAGHGKVRVEIVDPTDNEEAKRAAKDVFGIDPTPLRFANKNEKSVINAYFNVAISYIDQRATLGLEDLITVRVLDVGDVDITLRNLEYQLTKTIKKTVAEASSIDQLFASSKVKLTAYVTPQTLPEQWQDAPAKLQKAIDELKKQSGGKLEVATIEPTPDQAKQLRTIGVRPYQELFGGKVFYFNVVVDVAGHSAPIVLPEKLDDAELKAALLDGLKRAAPGFTRVVGLYQPPSGGMMPPMMEGMPPREMPPPQTFRSLEKALSGSYEVRPVMLDAPIPPEVETLVLAGPANLDAKAAEYVDQFVMRGGALVALAGRYRLAPQMGRGGLAVEVVKTGLEDTFAKWGIKVGDDLVMDTKSDSIVVPVDRGGYAQLAYPFFVKAEGDQLSSGPITGGLAGSIMHWASPVKVDAKLGDEPREIDTLLRSSSDAWLTTTTNVEPDFVKYEDSGFPTAKEAATDKKGTQVLAVALVGGLPSATVAAKPKEPPKDAKPAPHALEHSPADTRVVVFGSSAFVSDTVLQLAQQLDSDLALANLELVHNAVDWSLADTDLLAIRSRDAAAHTLTLDPDARDKWRTINLVIAFLALGAIVALAWWRRRAVAPVEVA